MRARRIGDRVWGSVGAGCSWTGAWAASGRHPARMSPARSTAGRGVRRHDIMSGAVLSVPGRQEADEIGLGEDAHQARALDHGQTAVLVLDHRARGAADV